MELIFRSRNGKVSERQRSYIEEKLGKLDRYLDNQITQATVELMEAQSKTEGETHRAQVTLVGEHGIILRADQHAGDLFSAIDAVHDTLQRQIKRYKERYWRHGRPRRQAGAVVPHMAETSREPTDVADDEFRPQIVRTKEFQIKPMSSEEAVEQMELLGHSFFVFRDAETGGINVVYRRQDGNYGLIVPGDVAG
jgi:putative sigma-54 modulation protein